MEVFVKQEIVTKMRGILQQLVCAESGPAASRRNSLLKRAAKDMAISRSVHR